MNRQSAQRWPYDPQLQGRIQAFELAFRMQTEAPEAFQIEKESEATKKLYGIDRDETQELWLVMLDGAAIGRAGRAFHPVLPHVWSGERGRLDAHNELVRLHTKTARHVDVPIAGLLKDLKSRGMLKDTLVLWGGEFDRTPISQGGDGRDHNPYGYTMWLAGAGVKAGTVYGATDEFGYYAVEDRMHIHDLHATILHLLGLEHEKLTYFYGGRNFRLTDVAGKVAKKIIA